MEKYLIENLRQNEYEVYIIKEYRKAKSVLSKFPDSMCFINIDEELSFSEWFNFMKSFQESDALKGIYLGILTETASMEDKDKFMMNKEKNLQKRIIINFIRLQLKITR